MTTGLTVSNGTGGTAINIGTYDAGGYSYIQSAYVNNAGVARELAFLTGSSESMRIDSSGNVGIGTTSVFSGNKLDVRGGNIMVGGFNTGTEYGLILTPSNTSSYWNVANITGGHLTFNNSATIGSQEKMRINSSGNLLVGTTTASLYNQSSTEGVAIHPDNLQVARNSNVAIFGNRYGTDGEVIRVGKDGSTAGSIGVDFGDRMYIGTGDTALFFNSTIDSIQPFNTAGGTRDDVIDLGSSAARFDNIYATNGTINTSDRNEKQDIAELTEAETRVAVAAKGLLRKFRWQSAVEEKGEEARIHFGIIAQDLQDAFTAEGLDASDYGMFVSSTWTDEETGEEKTRLGVRYSELLAFIIAAI
jgi:hypothetical protein